MPDTLGRMTIQPLSDEYLTEFFRGYVACALWCGVWARGPEDTEALHREDSEALDVDDLDPSVREEMAWECLDFVAANVDDLIAYAERHPGNDHDGGPGDFAGHDFWLTRNGHGAGYWDRGDGALGDRLSDASRPYGTYDLMLNDDGVVEAL